MFSGFLNRDRKQTADKGAGDSGQVFSSNAAAALAASVAAAPKLATAANGPQPKGRTLHGSNIQIDLDDLRPGEEVPELQVQPITLLKYDYKLEHTQQVAISSNYICYGLKAGHIRTLNRNTATRALFKGHPTSLSYITFFNPDNSLLASCSREGDIAVRLVTDAAGPDGDIVPAETLMMLGKLAVRQLDGTAAPPITLAWHPHIPQVLAAGAAGTVSIFEVPTAAPEQQPVPQSNPGITYNLPNDGTVTAVAFSPRGDLLVAADSTGYVHAWWIESAEDSHTPVMTWQPFSSKQGVSSVEFLHQADDGTSLLLTGDATNAHLKLWALPAAGAAGSLQPTCLQTVSLTSLKGPEDIFCHVVVQPQLQLVVLANTVRKQVYTLHYRLSEAAEAGPAAAHFDYLAFFAVKQPILSVTTGLEAVESQVVPGEVQPQQLLLYTVQTDAIQQYIVNPAVCSLPAGAATDNAAAAESEVSSSTAVQSSAEGDSKGTSEAEQSAAESALEQHGTGESVPGQSGQEAESELAAAVSQGPAAAAVPPPTQLPTPGLLLHAGSKAASAAARDLEAAAAAAALPALPAAAAAEGPEVAGTSAAGATAGTEAAAAAEGAAAAETTDPSAEPSAPEAPVPTTPARPAESAAAAAAAAVEAAPLPPMPTNNLIHSAEKAAAASPPATPPSPAAAEAGGVRELTAATAESATAAAAPPEPAEAAEPAVEKSAAGASSADVVALQQQMQQLLSMQQELAAQLQASSQQTVAGVRTELKSSLKGTETYLKQQFDSSMKATAKRSEEIRSKAATKERQELEKAIAAQLAQLSGNLQRDLQKVMADVAREQARQAVAQTVNQVTPQVAAAVTAALQKELGGGAGNAGLLQSALERSLNSSLARPLHEALRENFATSIIPAFERATQVMFGQVETAFSSWLADSNRTVTAAQSDATSALNSAVSQLNSVVGTVRTELADTSRTLSRMASSAANRTAEASSGGGARSVAQLEAGAGGRGAAPVDPRIEIGTLLGVRKYEEALVKALNTASLDVLIWTCKQVDPAVVLGGNSVGVSQTTLLSLVHQLAADLHNDANTALKMAWLNEAAPVVDPHDPVTAPHIKVVLTGVMNNLKRLVNSLPPTDATAKTAKITLHLFNSLLHQ